jgi:hypothetical protein
MCTCHGRGMGPVHVHMQKLGGRACAHEIREYEGDIRQRQWLAWHRGICVRVVKVR